MSSRRESPWLLWPIGACMTRCTPSATWDSPQDNEAGYRDSAPANFVQNLTGKLLVAHGTGDDNVHFANTALLLNKFIDEGKYPELQIFPGRGHPISDRAARIELFNKITQFFIDNL